MTILDQITKEAESLSTKERRTALLLLKALRTKGRCGAATARVSTGKFVVDKRKLHPALRAVVGMWKDRKDIPADTVEASRFLRKRMMKRGRSV